MAECQELLLDGQDKMTCELSENLATLGLKTDVNCAQHEQEEGMEQQMDLNGKDAETACMETDVELELEAGPQQSWSTCRKNPGHLDFLPVSQLELSHLPEKYRNPTMLEMVSNMAKLVVCVKVSGSSPHRPLDFPFSGVRYKQQAHSGTGQIIQSEEGEGVCPCAFCKTSGQPVQKWYSVDVITARHVVFDEIEGNMTRCYLNYDSDEMDLKTCQTLTNITEVIAYKPQDLSILVFAVHELKVGAELHTRLYNWRMALLAVKQLYFPAQTLKSLPDQWLELQDRFRQLVSDWEKVMDKTKSVMEGEISQQLQEIQNLDIDTTKSYLLIDIVISKLCNAERGQGWLDKMSYEHQQNIETLQSIETESLNRDRVSEIETKMLYLFNVIARTREKELLWFQNSLGMDGTDEPGKSGGDPLYDPSHPLTIIISHPHACGKRITFGEIYEKMDAVSSLWCSFSYTTPTCPGSSGAKIFILGYNANKWGLVHHGQKQLDMSQLNQSSVYGNW